MVPLGAAAAGHDGFVDDVAADLRRLYEAEYRNLVRLAAFLVDDSETAEDVVQEAFAKVLRRRRHLDDPGKAAAYVRSAVMNEARGRLRRRRVARAHPPPPSPATPAGDGAAVQHEVVVAALRRLPARQQQAVLLRYWLDLPEAEIAESLGVSPGAVKTHLHRARRALAPLLEER